MISIFSNDRRLFEMLTAECARGGFTLSRPEEASLFLIDLDTVAKLPIKTKTAVRIGFTAGRPLAAISADFILPVPYDTLALQQLLRRFDRLPTEGPALCKQGDALLLRGRHARLSAAELKIFGRLAEAKGGIVSADELSALLPAGSEKSNSLQVCIYRLRRKLSGDGILRILSVRGHGYRLLTGDDPNEITHKTV